MGVKGSLKYGSGSIADRAEDRLEKIKSAQKQGRYTVTGGPSVSSKENYATASNRSGEQFAERKKTEASFGLTRGRKAGYTGP